LNASTASPAHCYHDQAGKTETVEQLIRRAVARFHSEDLTVSPSKVSRMVRAEVRRTGSVATAARMVEAYVLSYADPTGETAIRNVMAGTR